LWSIVEFVNARIKIDISEMLPNIERCLTATLRFRYAHHDLDNYVIAIRSIAKLVDMQMDLQLTDGIKARLLECFDRSLADIAHAEVKQVALLS
jgi:hypothetical protein